MTRDDRTVASLEPLLRNVPAPGAALTLPASLDEVLSYCSDTRVAWPSQRISLFEDLRTSIRDLGPNVRSAVDAEVCALIRDTKQTLGAKAVPTDAAIAVALHSTQTLQLALARPETIRAAWDDLLVAVRRAESLDAADRRLQLLFGVLAAAHWEVEDCRRELRAILLGTAGPRSDGHSYGDEPATSATERLGFCANLFARSPLVGHCIAWLAYTGNLRDKFILDTGPVTFYQSNWAVPNARLESGQDFVHRGELRDLTLGWIDVPDDPSVVVARFDLGMRPAAGALAEAQRRSNFLVGQASVLARARPWKEHGWHALVIDGSGGFSSGFLTDDEVAQDDEPAHRRAVGLALTKSAPIAAIGIALLSVQLAEAVEMATIARTAELRTSILLRFRALELISSQMALERVENLLDLVRGPWAFRKVQDEITQALYATIMGAAHTVDPTIRRELQLAILEPVGVEDGFRLNYGPAIEQARTLETLCRTDLDRLELGRALSLLEEGPRFDARVKHFDKMEQLLSSRLLRVRNAITHGNPFTIAAADSIDRYLMYLSEMLLGEAVSAAASGKTLETALDDRLTHLAGLRATLVAGIPFPEALKSAATDEL